jgi:glycosyltransferase involved in cell wall biosynthesis
MKIALLEPYAVSSHLRWAEEWKQFSVHEIKIFSLPARHWKWRMHGAAITLSEQLIESGFNADVIVCTDMMDLSIAKSILAKQFSKCSWILYFHENQFAYPFSEKDSDKREVRDQHYAFINYSSALVADEVWFNSEYNKRSMLNALVPYLKRFPDFSNLHTIQAVENKSRVMYPGIEQKFFDLVPKRTKSTIPVVLWNHRWEYDKNPIVFFETLKELSDDKIPFELNVVGESFESYPPEFDEYKKKLASHIRNWGFINDRTEYMKILQESDIIAVTSNQEFFGYSVLEAIAAGNSPLLPDRLVYPEHVSDPRFLYSNKEEFAKKMRSILLSKSDLPSLSNLIKEKYLLESMVKQYDLVISSI